MKKTFSGKYKIITILLAVLISAVLLCIVGVTAKYVVGIKSGNKKAGTAKMYFVSSVKENTALSAYTVDGDIIFSLYNHDGLNISEIDVDYTIEVLGEGSDIATIKIDGDETSSSTLEYEDGAKKQSTVCITGLPVGTYTVKITSAPYKKVITLYYSVVNVSGGQYKVTEHESWTVVDIYTGADGADITVSYTGYAPDNTNSVMALWSTDSGSGNIENVVPYSHYSLIFFGSGSISIVQNGNAYTLVTP